ncbi:MAG: hypothetical protein IJT50_02840, partial [Lentisphaeria bacterium]|nr:hypothetical protein [Lentisphaeria bacterium]
MRRQVDIDKEALTKSYEKQPLDKIFPLVRPYKWLFVSSVVSLILFNMVGLTLPWMLKIAIDRVLPNADYLLFW